ncbi:MAG: PCP reductase family protein [Bacteroidota bacterium]|nr:PCP reductase family protein [Bacteroidota bacterium]
MALKSTHGPFDGSMSIVYECPTCTMQTAMLTNRAETQMVRSLGVRIGGRTTPEEPMETLRSNLSSGGEESKGEPPSSSGKCPFTGMVNDAIGAAEPEPKKPVWTEGALARIEAIPPYIQPMVKQNVESFAREQGCSEIDEDVMDAVRGSLGM